MTRKIPPPAPPWWRRRWAAVALAGVVVLAAAGVVGAAVVSNSDDAPAARPLTTDEADTLAVVRFQNYRRGSLGVTAVLPAAAGDVRLSGRVDFRRSIGSMNLRTDRRSDVDSRGIVQFSPAGVAFNAGATTSVLRPLPRTNWQRLPLRTDGSNPLNTLFALVLNLGTDRPENAQLLRQQGARWLRTDVFEGDAVTVYAGPSGESAQAAGSAPSSEPLDSSGARTRYWVDGDGLLRRFEARIGTNPRFAVVTLSKRVAGQFRVSSTLPLPTSAGK